MIRVDKVSKRFGSFALEQVSLSVERGAYWVLLGPSGSGKSLLLNLVAGLYAPDRGHLFIDEIDCSGLPPERRNIGLVFQQSALFPHYSVIGNIEYGLRARRLAPAERKRRVDEVVEAVRLEPIVGRPVATLSGGEAQKVAIARALAVRPRALLLDEPLSAIDYNARLELQEELQRLHRAFDLTTLHVTHSREEARALADGCAVMTGGHLVQSGPIDDVFERPRCRFVARFLGREEAAPADHPPCHERCLDPGGGCWQE